MEGHVNDPVGRLFVTSTQPQIPGGITMAEPYFIGLDRAMVSLGPLTGSTYCTYKCRFCYVNGPYAKYSHRSPEEIIDWLTSRRDLYNIVYVSGDTDSFAPPRTADAIES